jgi:hypothetical protein
MRTILAFCALLLASVTASAATYGYTGNTYTGVANFTVCALGSCGNYTPAMRPSGSFTTSANLAPNLVAASVVPLVTSYSFSDGLTTYSSADANSRLFALDATTDASGAILTITVIVEHWQTGPGPHVVGDRVDLVQLFALADVALHNLTCTAVGVSPAGTADVCTAPGGDTGTSTATGTPTSTFALLAAGTLGIPTLGEIALMLLALLMGAVAMAKLRPRRAAA